MVRGLLAFALLLWVPLQALAGSSVKSSLKASRLSLSDVLSVTNGILTLYINKTGSDAGTFTVATGPNHPHPGESVLYDGDIGNPGTSYLTVRSYTSQTDYISEASNNFIRSDFTIVSLSMDYPPDVTCSGNACRAVWVVRGRDSLTIEQLTVVEGTSLDDTLVRVSTTVRNDGDSAVRIGIRYEWDWEIDGSDDALIRRHNPDDQNFASAFFEEIPPRFEYYEETGHRNNNITAGTGSELLDWSVFGTVNGPFALTPSPTPPDRFNYSRWAVAYDHAWTFQVSGSGGDSAVCYYWGDTEDNAIVLNPGESYTVTQYITTFEKALNPVSKRAVKGVPAFTSWGVVILVFSVLLIGLRSFGSVWTG